ncbi:MAG: PAS domain-containing protein [Lentisphaerae bacterium]|nr:PAS domain-containing protein [Lentisphaerota bacterium]
MNSPDHQGNSAKDAAAQPGKWLRDVFNHSPDMIIILDRAGVIREANETFQTFGGLSRAAFVGKKITDFIPADGREQWTHNLNKLTSAEWTSVDGALLSGQGRAIPFQITLVAHSALDGLPVVILHFRDVSVYQTVARALVASQGQWERSFDAIADYMCLLDRSGRILRANHAMTQWLAPLYGNLVGRDHRAIFGAAAEAKQGATVSHAVEAAPFIIPAIELPRLKGYFTVSAFPLKDEHEAVSGAVLIVRDITAERATQEALKKAEANQHQTCKMEALGRLAGGIAHDFNNMLTSVLGYSALLLKTTKPDDPQRKEIQEIISAAERAAALTRQLLDFSRDESIETRSVSLNSVIRNMEELLRHTLGEKIKLTMRLDANLSNIKADVSRLEQVIINIVMNARDAMPNGDAQRRGVRN